MQYISDMQTCFVIVNEASSQSAHSKICFPKNVLSYPYLGQLFVVGMVVLAVDYQLKQELDR